MNAPPPVNDEETGLPFIRSWRAVYAFVTAVFVLYLILLALLPGWFA
jgi:hypothetical protein